MKLTDALKTRITKHEGLKLDRYTDSLGNATIGIGHAILANEEETYPPNCEISHKEVYYLFDNDLEAAAKDAEDLIGDLCLPLPVQEVIVEMVFQLGKNGVRKFKLMWAAFKKGDFLEAAYEMRDSRWYRQTQGRCDELASIVEITTSQLK